MISYVCDCCDRSGSSSTVIAKGEVFGLRLDLCASCQGIARRLLQGMLEEGKRATQASRERGRALVRELRARVLELEGSARELDELKAAIQAAAPDEPDAAPDELEQGQAIASDAQQLQDQGADPKDVAQAIVDKAYAAVERGELGFAEPLEPLEPPTAGAVAVELVAPEQGPGGV